MNREIFSHEQCGKNNSHKSCLLFWLIGCLTDLLHHYSHKIRITCIDFIKTELTICQYLKSRKIFPLLNFLLSNTYNKYIIFIYCFALYSISSQDIPTNTRQTLSLSNYIAIHKSLFSMREILWLCSMWEAKKMIALLWERKIK